jgi:hypothetical protein
MTLQNVTCQMQNLLCNLLSVTCGPLPTRTFGEALETNRLAFANNAILVLLTPKGLLHAAWLS